MTDVSVVIPTFRRPVELKQAIQSVLDQRPVRAEIIVVDDSPEASGEAIVESFDDPSIRYLRNSAPTGGAPGIVRNLGWPLATGRFVHFLDDDDVVPAGHYAAAIQSFEENPQAGMVFGRVEPFGIVAEQVDHERAYFARAAARALDCRRYGHKRAFAARLMFGETMLVCSAVMIRRECVSALKGFEPASRLVEDVDFYARAARRFGAHYMDRVCLQYRISVSLMHRPNVGPIIIRSYQLMYKNYCEEWGRADFLAMKIFARTLLRRP